MAFPLVTFLCVCFLLFSLLGIEAVFVQLLPVISPVAIISHCWVCWLSLHPLYFWRVSEWLHHDFVSLLSLSVRLLFLIITPLFPVDFSSFQPHFPPPNTFDCLPILVCECMLCLCMFVCMYFWCFMQNWSLWPSLHMGEWVWVCVCVSVCIKGIHFLMIEDKRILNMCWRSHGASVV